MQKNKSKKGNNNRSFLLPKSKEEISKIALKKSVFNIIAMIMAIIPIVCLGLKFILETHFPIWILCVSGLIALSSLIISHRCKKEMEECVLDEIIFIKNA